MGVGNVLQLLHSDENSKKKIPNFLEISFGVDRTEETESQFLFEISSFHRNVLISK